VYYDASTQDLALQNLDLAINILKSSNLPVPPTIQKLQANDLIGESSAEYVLFLETLRSIHEILNFGKNGAEQQY